MTTNTKIWYTTIRQFSSWRSLTAVGVGLALAGLLTACGGGGITDPNPTPAAKTALQINLGDAPADWMLAFSMNISSMSLMGSNGNVSVSASTPIEMMHLMGTMQPLAMISAPQGSYTGATVNIASATVMYIDPATKSLMQKTIAGPISATVNFVTPIIVGTTPMAMGFDLDLANSVTANSSAVLSMNPVFHVTSGMQGTSGPLDPINGGVQQMMGTVSGVTGSSFTMTSMQAAQTFTFKTSSSTGFQGTSMSGMTNGMLLIVDGSLQSDGSLMATQVQSMMNSGGVMGRGILTAVTGHPPTSLTMVTQNGAGTGMMSSYFAAGATIDLSASTTYVVDEDNMDMSGLPFVPVFDATHIYAGQSVMPISSSGMMNGGSGMMGGGAMGGTITASEVALEPQGITGTSPTAILSGSSTSFTITFPADSAFGTLTGSTSVTVFQRSDTTITSTSPIAVGSSVHVFGLLFFDAGQWKMVAARIGAN